MKVSVISLTEKEIENREYRDELQIEINGEKVFHVIDGEPEDANLSRDFSNCWRIPTLMRLAYGAGKKGEEFEIETVEREEI